MLSSGKGTIAITKDENFKGVKGKKRRVMISGTDPETGYKMVNRITSTSSETTMKLNRKDVPILQKDSYIDQEVHVKKKKGDAFKDSDLEETTSTINPFDFRRIFKFIFNNNKSKKNKEITKNNNYKGKKYK